MLIQNDYLRDAFNGYSFLSIKIREYDPVDAEKENFDFVNENHINKVRKCVNEPEFEFKHMDRVPQKKEKMKAIMTEGDIRTNWQEKHLTLFVIHNTPDIVVLVVAAFSWCVSPLLFIIGIFDRFTYTTFYDKTKKRL